MQLERDMSLVVGRGLQLVDKSKQLQTQMEDNKAKMSSRKTSATECSESMQSSVRSNSNLTDVAVKNDNDIETSLGVAATSIVDSVLARVLNETDNISTLPRNKPEFGSISTSLENSIQSDKFPGNLHTSNPKKAPTLSGSRLETFSPNLAANSRKKIDGLPIGDEFRAAEIRKRFVSSQKSSSSFRSQDQEEMEKLHFQLMRDREAILDLQDAIRTERVKSLEWMERHNQERDCHRLAQAELEEMNEQVRSLQNQSLRDKDELQQLKSLYKAEQSQSSVLENALAEERQNFRRLKHALDLERTRSREACDRDSDAILDLRNALEVQREIRANNSAALSVSGTPTQPVSSRIKRFGSFSVFPSASTGNIPGRFRSLTESLGACNSSEAGLNYRPSAPCWQGHMDVEEEEAAMASVVDRLQRELEEERNRVDALKSCLEQERQKYDRLAEQMQHQQTQPLPLLTLTPANLFGRPSSSNSCQSNNNSNNNNNNNNLSSLQDEMMIYHQRRLENVETQKLELSHELERARKLIGRLHSEIERLKGQIRIYQNANLVNSASASGGISFEKFYLRDLEEKLEAYRNHEFELEEKLCAASGLIRDLQEENETLVKREADFVHQMLDEEESLEFCWERKKQSEEDDSVKKKLVPMYKVNHLLSVNEAMNDRIKLLENQVLRLKERDDHVKEYAILDRDVVVAPHGSADEAWKAKPKLNGIGNKSSGKSSSPTCSESGSEKNPGHRSFRNLRLEGQRRALVWQKKYLMLLITQLEQGKDHAFTSDPLSVSLNSYNEAQTKLKKFRIAALCVVAVKRMEILCQHWKIKRTRMTSQESI